MLQENVAWFGQQITQNIEIPPLTATATATPTNGAAPFTVQFTGQASGGRSSGTPIDTTDDHQGTVTAAGENNDINPNWEVATNAFDDTTGTKWLDFATNYPSTRQSWIQYQYANGQRFLVTQYTITSANDAARYPERNPADWRLLGSNNGGASWVTLDIQTNQVFTANFQKLAYAFTNTTAYNLYRFQIDRVANPSPGGGHAIGRIGVPGGSVALLVLLVLRRRDHLHQPESAAHLRCQWHLHSHARGFRWPFDCDEYDCHSLRPAGADNLAARRGLAGLGVADMGHRLYAVEHH